MITQHDLTTLIMNQEKFIKVLEQKKYSYRIIGSTILIDHHEHIDLRDLVELPENIIFKNNGYVALTNLEILPDTVKFENNGEVYLKNTPTSYGHYTPEQ